LTQQNWTGAPLRDLVEGATAAYRSQDQDRFEIDGPNVRVPPRAALALALAIHELCTNASKYGALSQEKGRVKLLWSVQKGRRLHIRWSEHGGPPVEPPTRRGFGSRLIERGLASDLGGEISIDFLSKGVVCTIDAPLEVKEKGEAVHA
jgi:two-component sensor histidine kinase